MVKMVQPNAIKKMISYYYLVSYCPPGYIDDLRAAGQSMFSKLAISSRCSTEDFIEIALPDVARRILAFHQATREPEIDEVDSLARLLKTADSSPQQTADFQSAMDSIVAHPNRAKSSNRLHRLKGCAFCSEPCRYGFFSLVSEPDFHILKALLDAENQKLVQQRDVVRALWNYTKQHIWSVLGTEAGIITAEHIGNLSYCLLLLGTAKSRFALPEAQLKQYLEQTRVHVLRLKETPISLA